MFRVHVRAPACSAHPAQVRETDRRSSGRIKARDRCVDQRSRPGSASRVRCATSLLFRKATIEQQRVKREKGGAMGGLKGEWGERDHVGTGGRWAGQGGRMDGWPMCGRRW